MGKAIKYNQMHRVADRIDNAGRTNTRQHESPIITANDVRYIKENPDKLELQEIADIYGLSKDDIVQIKNKITPVSFI